MRTLIISMLLGLAACAQSGHCASQDGNQDGSRLLLEWVRYGDDNVCISSGNVFDSQRQEWCVAADWDDGEQYCSPTQIGSVAFSDAACTQVLGASGAGFGAGSGSGSGSGAYVGQYNIQGQLVHLWRPGTAVTSLPPAGFYYVIDNNECQPRQCMAPDVHSHCDFTVPGTEIPRTELEHERTVRAGSGRFQPIHVHSDDGMEVQVGTLAHDTMLDTDCSARTFVDGTVCEPTQHGVTTLWSDAQCSQPLFYEQDASVVPPPFAYMDPLFCSSSKPRIYQTGAAIAPAGAYNLIILTAGAVSTCDQVDPTPEGGFFAMTPADMSVSRARDKVSGRRLQIIHFAGDSQWRDHVVYDTELHVECVASRGRCYPTAFADAFSLFSDPLCTTPVEVAFPPAPDELGYDCALPPMPAFANSAEGIRRVIGSAPMTVYGLEGSTCVTAERGPGYLAGDPLPASTFARTHSISYP